MDSPQKRIMNELRNYDDKTFALIINDTPITMRFDEEDRIPRQVYVKSQQSRLIAIIYRKLKNRLQTVETPVDVEKFWNFLSTHTNFYGFDFSTYLASPNAEFKVVINDSFEMLFIESPAITFVKNCVKETATKSINSLMISGIPSETLDTFKRNWVSILGEFQVSAALRYIFLMTDTMKRKLQRKMFFEKNMLFKESIVKDKVNFLHLFLETPGLYNPFLQDPQLMAPTKNSFFAESIDNPRLFVRDGYKYKLHCMTVNDYCASVGLSTKLGFTPASALLFLFAMTYTGTFNEINIPLEDMTGYMVQDRELDTGKLVNVSFYTKEPPSSDGQYERAVIPVNGLDAFSIKYSPTLGDKGKLTPAAIKNILINAQLERR